MENASPTDISTWKVLIVDDEPDNLGVAMKILNYNGATVHIAADGIEGLAVLHEIQPTFVLLDLSMPKMDGWEMLKVIRDQDDFGNLPVIALTAHAMAGDEERALEAGFDGYITKPFRLDTFLADIKRHLSNSARLNPSSSIS